MLNDIKKKMSDTALDKLEKNIDTGFEIEIPVGKDSLTVKCSNTLSAEDFNVVVGYITGIIENGDYQMQYLDIVMPSVILGYMTNLPVPYYEDEAAGTDDTDEPVYSIDMERCYEIYKTHDIYNLMVAADARAGETIAEIETCVKENIAYLRNRESSANIDELLSGVVVLTDAINDGVDELSNSFKEGINAFHDPEQIEDIVASIAKSGNVENFEKALETIVNYKIAHKDDTDEAEETDE